MSPEGARISNQATERGIYIMVVIKRLDAIKGPRVKVDGPLCGGLYKEDHGSIIPWSGTDPDAKMNSFTSSTNVNDWIILGDQYNEEFNNWRGNINNGQFHDNNLKEMRKTENIVQNLTWSLVYLRSTLSNDLLQKVLTLVPLTPTGPEVYVATMTTIIPDFYYSLVNTLNHTKNLKLKYHPGRDVVDCYDAILVNVESLESDGAFKPEQLGYIIRIFENTSDSRFHIWPTQKYKEIMEFVKKPLLCDEKVMQTDDIIIYGFLAQEYL